MIIFIYYYLFFFINSCIQKHFFREIDFTKKLRFFFPVAVSPSIDKGQAGSKTVKTNRTAIWQIKCKGGKIIFDWFLKRQQIRNCILKSG